MARWYWNSQATNNQELKLSLGIRIMIPSPFWLHQIWSQFGQWASESSKILNLLQTRTELHTLAGLILIQFFVSVQRRVLLFSITERVKERFLASQSMVKRSPTVIGTQRASLLHALKTSFSPSQTNKVTLSKIHSSWKLNRPKLSGAQLMILRRS